jgi:hypothetical protein
MQGFKPDIIDKLFRDNAIRLLRLESAVQAATLSSAIKDGPP